MSADIRLDCSKMSSLTKQLLGSSIFADLVEHFNNPENQRRFEEWKKERESNVRRKTYECDNPQKTETV